MSVPKNMGLFYFKLILNNHLSPFMVILDDFGDALLSVDNISAIHGFSCKLLL